MSDALVTEGAHWVALVLIAAAIACACAAAMARSLFSMTAWLFAIAALASAALLALSAGDSALNLILLGVGFTPALILALLLLSTRAAKSRRRGAPWLTITAAAAAGAVVVMGALKLAPSAAPVAAPPGALAPWLVLLVFTGAIACVGLLGFGERGALERVAPSEQRE